MGLPESADPLLPGEKNSNRRSTCSPSSPSPGGGGREGAGEGQGEGLGMLRFGMLLEVLEEPCPACGGRGWVLVSDGQAGTARPCACRQRDIVPRLIAAAGVPPRYRHCRLTNFH